MNNTYLKGYYQGYMSKQAGSAKDYDEMVYQQKVKRAEKHGLPMPAKPVKDVKVPAKLKKPEVVTPAARKAHAANRKARTEAIYQNKVNKMAPDVRKAIKDL